VSGGGRSRGKRRQLKLGREAALVVGVSGGGGCCSQCERRRRWLVQKTSASIKKVIEENTNDPFLLLEEHFFTAFLVHKKLMNYNSKICRMKFLSSSQNHKVSGKIFVNHKFYHNNFTLTIFLQKTCILNVTLNKMYSSHNIAREVIN
jgi:hypothetical protein